MSIFIRFCGELRKHVQIETNSSRSSKVIYFGTNRKRVGLCDFLIVRHSNLGHILLRFRDIAVFYSQTDPDAIPPEFCRVPVGPDRPCSGHFERKS